MFWKKDKPSVFVNLDTENARHAYRVIPGEDPPIILMVDGERGRILNISTTGIAFILEDACDPLPVVGQKLQAALILGGPTRRHPIAVELDIVEQRGSYFRSRLISSTTKAQKDLCRYVITAQKNQIRRLANEPADTEKPLVEDKNEEF